MRSSLPRHAGFTLIELMVVVAIVAILAALALPSYRDYVIRGNLVEGTQQLAAQRAKMEQFYQDSRQYTTHAPYTSPCDTMPTTPRWTFSCTSVSAAAYTIEADGSGPVANFKYTIKQDNSAATLQLGAGWPGAPAACWITTRGGTCS